MSKAAAKKAARAESLPRTESQQDIPPLHTVDYEALAKRCGDKAYQRALDADLPLEVAEQFREVFGQPIDDDLRLI